MKQRIEPSQLAELTPVQQEKLRAWWKPEEGDIYGGIGLYGQCVFNGNDKDIENYIDLFNDKIKPHCLPLLSIGQCIELINCMVNINNAFAEYPKAWCVMNMNKKKEYWAEELIDALWEVVKSIL